jgi:hypothetical protein
MSDKEEVGSQQSIVNSWQFAEGKRKMMKRQGNLIVETYGCATGNVDQ